MNKPPSFRELFYRLDQDYAEIMNALNVAVSAHLLDEHFTVLWASQYFYKFIDYTKAEYENAYHNHVDEYMRDTPETFAQVQSAVVEALAKEQDSVTLYPRFRKQDGSRFSAKLVCNFSNEVVDGKKVIYAFMTDVTELQRSQKEKAIAYDSIPGFVVKYRIGKTKIETLEANSNFFEFYGIDPSKIALHIPFSMAVKEDRLKFKNAEEAMRRKERIHFVIRSIGRTGEQSWLQVNGDCIDTIDNDPVYMFIYTDITNITEQRELQRRLEERNAQLRDALEIAKTANSAKTDFLARMSHDLRTPINAIVGTTSLAETYTELPKIREALKTISASSEYLLSLINEILDMNRIENGQLRLKKNTVALPELFRNLTAMLMPEITRKNQILEIARLDITHEKIYADADRLRQVFINLLDNAIKYTPEGGTIRLSFLETSEISGIASYEFIFEDNGIGMPEEFMTRIFKPFERAETPECRHITGSGLGLSIAQNIVRLMGGRILVESVYKKGSIFRVQIPLRTIDAPESLHPELKDQPVMLIHSDYEGGENIKAMLEETGIALTCAKTEEEITQGIKTLAGQNKLPKALILCDVKPELCELVNTLHTRYQNLLPIICITRADKHTTLPNCGVSVLLEGPVFRSTLTQVLHKVIANDHTASENTVNPQMIKFKHMNVLIVEDNLVNARIACEIVKSLSAVPVRAETGEEALRLFCEAPEFSYDMILMDIRLPGLDGYETATRIRALPRADAADIPIVAMTANTFPEDIARSYESGMNYHLAKPIDIPILSRVLARFVPEKLDDTAKEKNDD